MEKQIKLDEKSAQELSVQPADAILILMYFTTALSSTQSQSLDF